MFVFLFGTEHGKFGAHVSAINLEALNVKTKLLLLEIIQYHNISFQRYKQDFEVTQIWLSVPLQKQIVVNFRRYSREAAPN